MKWLLLILLCVSNVAWAEGGIEGTYQIIIKKQEEKKKSRWSIYDWLETKKKFALQDQWLALHTSDVSFESYVGAQFLSGTTDFVDAFSSADLFDSVKAEAAFFYRIFGLQASYVNLDDRLSESGFGWNGSLHLRLLGTGIQNSNLTLGYGLRHREQDLNGLRDKLDNTYAEAALTIYVLSFFGIEGAYQHYFPGDSENSERVDGSRAEGSLFFEFSFIRVFATVYEEKLEAKSGTSLTAFGNSGWNGGVRLYF